MTTELEKTHEVIDRWLYLPDKVPLHVLIATKTAVFLPSDPVWMMVLGPSGAGKSELIKSLEDGDSYLTNKLTSKVFAPGLRLDEKQKAKSEQEEIDLLPKIDGKCLLIPDLSSILNMPDQERGAIFAALCDAYDGKFTADFGSIGQKSLKSRFGFIAGTTEVIDQYLMKLTAFGQRFLRIIMRYSIPEQAEATEKAMSIAGKEPVMREEIHAAIHSLLQWAKIRAYLYVETPIEPHVSQSLEALVTAMASLRTGIVTDPRTGRADYMPHHELGMRAAKQLTNLGRCLACLYDHKTVGSEEYAILARVARDCIPEMRLRIVQNLEEWTRARNLAYLLHVKPSWLHQQLDQLYALEIVNYKEKDGEGFYRVDDYYQEVFSIAGVVSYEGKKQMTESESSLDEMLNTDFSILDVA